jgi:methionine biosynthesis protein MetW
MNPDSLDTPLVNDNRNYDYTEFSNFERDDYRYIVEMVNPNSSIIDLGCGNGALIQKLIKEKKANAKGVELSESGVKICFEKGLDVIRGEIDKLLPFADNEFDLSICHITIQMVMYPEVLLSEMKRISRNQIISFPNFAFYKNRIDLLINGRMPNPMLFGYKWFSTGHIHQFSIKDFEYLINEVGGLKIEQLSWVK